MAESVIRALRKRKLVKITLITVGKVFEERLRAMYDIDDSELQ